MDISGIGPCPTDVQKVIDLFCIIWPFLAMPAVPRRGQSSAPFNAALVALAVVACGLWVDLADVVGGLAVGGGGVRAAAVGGTFEATAVVLWPLAWIAVFTLFLRHRPQVDSFVLALGAILALHVLAAFLFVQVLAPSLALIVFARTAAAVTLPTAMIAALRLFVATRG